jgi:serine/threonine-protein kinase HipA
VARWRETAGATGLSDKEIDRMASAFEHEELKKAVALSG